MVRYIFSLGSVVLLLASSQLLPLQAQHPPASAGTKNQDPPAPTKTIPLAEGIAMELILIPAGEFLMGSPPDEPKRARSEGPQHQVVLAQPFYMGKYEVTQAQWQAVMGDRPSLFKGNDQRPVENINWKEAQKFCRKMTEKTGCPTRLPSEAEWEYACRAGTTTAYSFGNDENELEKYAWFITNSGGQPHPVGQKKPNPWGLYDLHGNVWEWCQDVFHSNYTEAPADGSPRTKGDKDTHRVLRGGSWDFERMFLRSAQRGALAAGVGNGGNGLRVVVTTAPPTSQP